jgi:hypothetical protein
VEQGTEFNMKARNLAASAAAALVAANVLQAGMIEAVPGPDISQRNRHYVSNREPLLPSQFIALPLGSVEPQGWLREMLNRQRGGLTGHLGEISAWLQKEDNAWLSKDGKGRYGWEELPYWLKGYIELAYLFDDAKMKDEVHIWIEGVLASQRANGDFGPDQNFEDGSRDYWANMIMLFCLQSYYERTGDARVVELMTKYFRYQLTVPDEKMLTHYWQKMRGGDNLHSIYWLYNITGDQELLKVAEKIHRCTANWRMKNDLPNWHNVNIAQCFREPAEFYLQSHAALDLEAAYGNFQEVRKRFGQVPGGMFGSDENCRPGHDDPRQAVETCGMVEQMLSDEIMLRISGDPFWADHCEDVAFNTYPTAVMPDFKSLRYLTAPNMVVSDSKNHAPGVQNGGPFMMMNPFSCRCCQHNHSHGWPYFCKSLWMATPDNGLLAALYSASSVQAKVGEGASIRVEEETGYPFDDTINLKIHTDKPAAFPLYLRIPAWCKVPELALNGKPAGMNLADAKFLRIRREWQDGDTVSLRLPMRVSVRTWTRNHGSVSVDRGPLTYSLKIGERYERCDSTKTAIGDSQWQRGADTSKWPSYEIHSTTDWNYGLVLDANHPETSFKVKPGTWPADNYPFTADGVPVTMEVQAKKVPEWSLDRYGLCAVLQDSPVQSDEPIETVTLIPMGAARLRISAFPVIGAGPDARRWVGPKPSPYKASASHCFADDTVEALGDGLVPSNSGDPSIPRFTWWDHRGTTEWVQYDVPDAQSASSAEVYWFDDTGTGACRIPASWRVLYRDGEQWKPVSVVHGDAPAKDRWNRVTFQPVHTTALRIEAGLQRDYSGGILEWRLK